MSVENTKNRNDDNPVRDLLLNDPDYRDIDIKAAMIIDNALHMGLNFPEEQESVNMCDLVTEWENGLREEGKRLAKDAYRRLAEKMKDAGYSSDDLARIMLDENFCNKMMRRFGIS